MTDDTRALIAALGFASITGKTVAGLHDHAAMRDRRLAAQRRGQAVQAHDGDRDLHFGGTLPDIRDQNGQPLSRSLEGHSLRAYDRTANAFTRPASATGWCRSSTMPPGPWFAYDVQDADAPNRYHRASTDAR
jgi:hypothetical protein